LESERKSGNCGSDQGERSSNGVEGAKVERGLAKGPSGAFSEASVVGGDVHLLTHLEVRVVSLRSFADGGSNVQGSGLLVVCHGGIDFERSCETIHNLLVPGQGLVISRREIGLGDNLCTFGVVGQNAGVRLSGSGVGSCGAEGFSMVVVEAESVGMVRGVDSQQEVLGDDDVLVGSESFELFVCGFSQELLLQEGVVLGIGALVLFILCDPDGAFVEVTKLVLLCPKCVVHFIPIHVPDFIVTSGGKGFPGCFEAGGNLSVGKRHFNLFLK